MCTFTRRLTFKIGQAFSTSLHLCFCLRTADTMAESRHQLWSGSCPRLVVPQTRLSTIGDQSFCVTVARAWNSFSTSITALTSLPSFKRQLKTFFIYQILPISLIFLLVICVPCPRSYCSLCHVNLYVLLLLLLLMVMTNLV